MTDVFAIKRQCLSYGIVFHYLDCILKTVSIINRQFHAEDGSQLVIDGIVNIRVLLQLAEECVSFISIAGDNHPGNNLYPINQMILTQISRNNAAVADIRIKCILSVIREKNVLYSSLFQFGNMPPDIVCMYSRNLIFLHKLLPCGCFVLGISNEQVEKREFSHLFRIAQRRYHVRK